MNKKTIKLGKLHKIPSDFENKLKSNSFALTKWNEITPLARNEYICWINSA